MSCATIARHIGQAASRFASANEGNIAVIFGIVILPVLAFVGAAIDYSRANMARSSMQAAMDSTALMLSRDLTQGLITPSQINTKAQAYFSAMFTDKEAQSVSINTTYTPGTSSTGATIQIDGSGSITTHIMRVVGFPTMGFNTTATTTWGASKLRIALVLDNTGSMANFNKIGALQTAAKNLVSQLSNLAQTNGDVYLSVVPFEIDVNVGTSNVNASWLRWDSWDPKNYPNASAPWQTYCSGGYWMTMAQCQGHGYT
jgi:Flp pilus assembly protein TadG